MSQAITRKVLSDRNPFAGHNWWYEFVSIPRHFSENAVKRFSNRLTEQCAQQTKKWNSDLNSQWVCRDFLALKMILSSSVMAQSLEYAEEKNLRVVISYLEYYTVLNLLRAIVFTDPNTPWNSGKVIQQSHSTIINNSTGVLAKLDRQLANAIKEQTEYLKASRELISYNAPTSGDHLARLELPLKTIDLCRLLAEIAQLQSEIFENSVSKHARAGFTIKHEHFSLVCSKDIEGYSFDDHEDGYRLHYIQRKHPIPTNLLHMMSEGHVEDFFGSWCNNEEKRQQQDGDFNPDQNWGIIFDVP
jgi:hypothetical protein